LTKASAGLMPTGDNRMPKDAEPPGGTGGRGTHFGPNKVLGVNRRRKPA
jgi:hypothetical protein